MEISKKKKLSLVNTSYSDLKWMITIIEWVRTDKTCCGCLSPSELRTSFWYQGIILSGLFVVQLKCSRNENLANMQQFCRMYGRIDLLHSRGIRNFRKNGNAISRNPGVYNFFFSRKRQIHILFLWDIWATWPVRFWNMWRRLTDDGLHSGIDNFCHWQGSVTLRQWCFAVYL